ncbi:MAG: T9SS type A sorting domain-containing protein [Sporocytophaga sp.]|nr:T9SS type A sorting domain-containing protein [Sporocytophaga sp.]
MKKLIPLMLAVLLFSPKVNAQTAAENLIVYYPLDGNTNDYSGKGNHGEAFNVTPAVDRKYRDNSSCSFNGINSYVNIPEIVFTNKEFTIMAWYKLSVQPKITDRKNILTIGNDEVEFSLLVEPSSNSIFKFQKSAGYSLTPDQGSTSCSSLSSSDNFEQWFHFAFSFGQQDNGENVTYITKCYIGGNYFSSSSALFPSGLAKSISATVGASNAGINYFQGSIDEVRIYDRQLTDKEISDTYNETLVTAISQGEYIAPVIEKLSFPESENELHVKVASEYLSKESKIILYTLQGNKVSENSISQDEEIIDFPCSSGIYLACLVDGGEIVARRKFFKK